MKSEQTLTDFIGIPVWPVTALRRKTLPPVPPTAM
jgi:hypothetical protein